MPNTMPTLCMDRFVSVDICDLRQAGTHAGIWPSSILETIGYKQISTGIKQKGPKSKTGRQRGNKDYESAALTIELRAQTSYLLWFISVFGNRIWPIVTIFATIASNCHCFSARTQRSAATCIYHFQSGECHSLKYSVC